MATKEEILEYTTNTPENTNRNVLSGMLDNYNSSSENMAIGVVDVEDEHGGIIREITAVSLANDTVSPETLARGIIAHDHTGAMIVGTADIISADISN